MPSVVGLLEQRELTARRRVDELREEADASTPSWTWQNESGTSGSSPAHASVRCWPPTDGDVAGPDASEDLPNPGGQPVRPELAEAPKPKSVVPMWRAGLAWSALSVDYQRSCRLSRTGTDSVKVR